MNKIVSVIVPVYNRAGFILKTLDNLKESNYRPLELLLVDDGSSDDSLRILNEFKTQNSDSLFDVKVFTQKNQGAPIARNFGFSKSKGDFIQFLDSDDLIAPDKFSSQVSLMNTTGSDFCLSDFELINLGGDTVYHSNAEKLGKVVRTHGSFGCGSALMNRSLSSKIRWNVRLKRNQDVDFFLKIALLADNISHIPKPLYKYIRHEEERISAIYSLIDPVYALRINSLLEIWKFKRNRVEILRSLFNLTLSLLHFKIKNISKKINQ